MDGERLARLEEQFKTLAVDTGDIMNDVRAIRNDVGSIRLHMAEQRGIRQAVNYISHFCVGAIGVAGTYFGIKH